jgi:undecaprenyl-diphosphatase
MGPFQAVILGIIQGLTEFLPVSSSGHLVLIQNLFGLKEPELLFDISLHVGTLIAICVVFYDELRSIFLMLIRLPELIRTSGGLKPVFADNEEFRIAALIVVGSIPTAILGFMFHKIADYIFGAIWIVGLMLIVTGMLLWFTRRLPLGGRLLTQVSSKDALVIGLVQGVAIIPGISRSGSTIAVALFLGVNRELAGRYSFLLSIPAILGALVLDFGSSLHHTSIAGTTILLGAATAGIVGFAALKLLLRLIKQGQLYCFAPYCWFAGATALVWTWV